MSAKLKGLNLYVNREIEKVEETSNQLLKDNTRHKKQNKELSTELRKVQLSMRHLKDRLTDQHRTTDFGETVSKLSGSSLNELSPSRLQKRNIALSSKVISFTTKHLKLISQLTMTPLPPLPLASDKAPSTTLDKLLVRKNWASPDLKIRLINKLFKLSL